MGIVNQHAGRITLSTGESSDSYTLPFVADLSKTELVVSGRGGNDVVQQSNWRAYIENSGNPVTTKVHVIRQANGSELVVEFTATESNELFVQNMQTGPLVDGSNPDTIATIDPARAYINYLGSTSTGSTRGEDDIHAIEIDGINSVNIEIDSANSAIVNYQVVQVAASSIASVNLYKVNQSGGTVDTPINNVDKDKCLIIGGGVFAGASGGDMLQSRHMPTWELLDDDTLRSFAYTANSKLTSWVQVIEFTEMAVTHERSTISSDNVSSAFSSAPAFGGARINGIFGRFVSANDADDDSRDNMFAASIAGNTTTFEREYTSSADVSRSIYDLNQLQAFQNKFQSADPGWGLVVISNAVVNDFSVLSKVYTNGSQIHFDTNGGNTSIAANGVFVTDQSVITGEIWDIDTDTIDTFAININQAGGDSEDPSIPTNFQVVIGTTTATVTCDPATDNVGVTGYRWYLDGVEVDTSVSPSYDFTGLSPDTPYSVTVSAFDGASNESAQSQAVNFRTDAEPAPAPVYSSYITAINMGPADTQLFTLNTETDPDQWEGEGGSPILPKP